MTIEDMQVVMKRLEVWESESVTTVRGLQKRLDAIETHLGMGKDAAALKKAPAPKAFTPAPSKHPGKP